MLLRLTQYARDGFEGVLEHLGLQDLASLRCCTSHCQWHVDYTSITEQGCAGARARRSETCSQTYQLGPGTELPNTAGCHLRTTSIRLPATRRRCSTLRDTTVWAGAIATTPNGKPS